MPAMSIEAQNSLGEKAEGVRACVRSRAIRIRRRGESSIREIANSNAERTLRPQHLALWRNGRGTPPPCFCQTNAGRLSPRPARRDPPPLFSRNKTNNSGSRFRHSCRHPGRHNRPPDFLGFECAFFEFCLWNNSLAGIRSTAQLARLMGSHASHGFGQGASV
jgi:hypothetical protein